MRNQNACYPLLFEAFDQFEQVVTISFIKCSCRLIQYEDFYILFKRFCDFDQLLLTDAKRLDFGFWVNKI